MGKCRWVPGFVLGHQFVGLALLNANVDSLLDVSGAAVCVGKDSSHDGRLRLLKRRKLTLADPSPCEGGMPLGSAVGYH